MKPLPKQILITDVKKSDPVAIAKNLPRNSGIILRDYDMPGGKRFTLGLELKKICREKGMVFLVSGDARLALKLQADGVHFPEYLAAEILRWRNKKPGWIITTSIHSRIAAKFAYDSGADAIMVSPVFATASHPGKKPLGVIRASHYIYMGISAYALGGVLPCHSKWLEMAGFLGFAGISWGKNCGHGATVEARTCKKYPIVQY